MDIIFSSLGFFYPQMYFPFCFHSSDSHTFADFYISILSKTHCSSSLLPLEKYPLKSSKKKKKSSWYRTAWRLWNHADPWMMVPGINMLIPTIVELLGPVFSRSYKAIYTISLNHYDHCISPGNTPACGGGDLNLQKWCHSVTQGALWAWALVFWPPSCIPVSDLHNFLLKRSYFLSFSFLNVCSNFDFILVLSPKIFCQAK